MVSDIKVLNKETEHTKITCTERLPYHVHSFYVSCCKISEKRVTTPELQSKQVIPKIILVLSDD